MNNTPSDWENRILPVPYDLAESFTTSSSDLTKYLMDGFEAAFAQRPVLVRYSTYPDGLYAAIVVPGFLALDYNWWAVMIGSRLRAAGIRLHLCVLTDVDVGLAKPGRTQSSPECAASAGA